MRLAGTAFGVWSLNNAFHHFSVLFYFPHSLFQRGSTVFNPWSWLACSRARKWLRPLELLLARVQRNLSSSGNNLYETLTNVCWCTSTFIVCWCFQLLSGVCPVGLANHGRNDKAHLMPWHKQMQLCSTMPTRVQFEFGIIWYYPVLLNPDQT